MFFLLLLIPLTSQSRLCTYRIKKGETLYSIARASGISFSKLLKINRKNIKNPHRVKVGQRILVPCKALENLEKMCAYRVKKGDSLIKIAVKTGTSLKKIIEVNNLPKKHLLRVGEILMLPCEGVMDWKIISKVKLKDTEIILPRRFRVKGLLFTSPVLHPRRAAIVKNRIDIPVSKGEKIVAVANGKVVYVERSIHAMGTLVLVKHKRGLYTVYSGSNIRWRVREGHYYKRGWIMGYATDDTVLRIEFLKGSTPIAPLRIFKEGRS